MRVFGTSVAFDDANPRRPLDRGEVFRRQPHLLVGHHLRQLDHRVRVRLARVGRSPQAVPEVLKLPHEVRDRQPGRRRVLGTSFAVGKMARAASARRVARAGGRAVLDDRRHRRRMILREPVDHVVAVAHVDERVGRAAAAGLARPRLLGRIFVRPQISGRCGLRRRFVAGFRHGVEPVGPQRLAVELDRGCWAFGLWRCRGARLRAAAPARGASRSTAEMRRPTQSRQRRRARCRGIASQCLRAAYSTCSGAIR